MLIEDNIKAIYRDSEKLEAYDTVLQGLSGEVYIKEDELEKGDRVIVVRENEDNVNEGYRESFYLSTLNKRLLKDLSMEMEFSFENSSSQWIEFLFRGVSRWDTSYTIDECYVFGYKNGDFYFCKRGYHEEGGDSYPYKQVFDLTEPGDDTKKYFVNLKKEHKNILQISQDKLNSNERYIIKCELIGDKANLKIRNVNKTHTQVQHYTWVTIFENVTIKQNINDISNRTVSLEQSVSVFEPFSVLQEQGFYGFSVPNSHLKVYRYEVVDHDKFIESRLYGDEEYSREISPEFAILYNNNKEKLLNSVKIGEEIGDNFNEYDHHEGDTIEIDKPLKTSDIYDIQINQLRVNKEDFFEDKFLEVKSMDSEVVGDSIACFVDEEQKQHLGQEEKVIPFEYETDGVSTSYAMPQEVRDIVGKFPNSKIGDILIEIDNNILMNNTNVVGIRENFDEFIDKNELNKIYSRRKFYMESTIRGFKEVIELGTIQNNNFTFKIDDAYLRPNRSYLALWKYNSANFINDFCAKLFEFFSINDLRGIVHVLKLNFNIDVTVEDIQSSHAFFSVIDDKMKAYGVSLGECYVNVDNDLIHYLRTEPHFIKNGFNVNDSNMNLVVKQYIEDGAEVNEVRFLLDFLNSTSFQLLHEVLESVFLMTDVFFVKVSPILSLFGDDVYLNYFTFRNTWLKDLEYNSILSTEGTSNRKFFISVPPDDYEIDDENNKITFYDTYRPGKEIKVRVFYDLSFPLTKNYVNTQTLYDVPESVKTLHVHSNKEKGIKKFVNYISDEKISISNINGIIFSVIPNELNKDGEQLYYEFEQTIPYLSSNNRVRRNAKAPLVDLDQLLKEDFEASKEEIIFTHTQDFIYDDLPTYCIDVSGNGGSEEFCYDSVYERDYYNKIKSNDPGVIGVSEYDGPLVNRKVFEGWNRPNDYIDTRTEVISGYWKVVKDRDFKQIPYHDRFLDIIVNFNEAFNGKETPILSSISGSIDEFSTISGSRVGVVGLNDYNYLNQEGDIYFKYDEVKFYPLNDGIHYDNYNNFRSGLLNVPLDDDIGSNMFKQKIENGVLLDEDNKYEDPSVLEEYAVGRDVPFVHSLRASNNFITPFVLKPHQTIDFEDLSSFLPSTEIIDKYLDVNSWFNFGNSKLGFYYMDVIREVSAVKSNNRYYSDKIDMESDVNPLDLNVWFDGYYSGDREPLKDLLDFDIYSYKVNNEGELIKKSDDELDDVVVPHRLYDSDNTPSSDFTEAIRFTLIEQINSIFNNSENNTINVSEHIGAITVDMGRVVEFGALEWVDKESGGFRIYGNLGGEEAYLPIVRNPQFLGSEVEIDMSYATMSSFSGALEGTVSNTVDGDISGVSYVVLNNLYGQYIQYELDPSIYLDSYKIMFNDALGSKIKNWDVEVQHDQYDEWTLVDRQENQDYTYGTFTSVYSLENAIKAYAVRFTFHLYNEAERKIEDLDYSGEKIKINEVKFYGSKHNESNIYVREQYSAIDDNEWKEVKEINNDITSGGVHGHFRFRHFRLIPIFNQPQKSFLINKINFVKYKVDITGLNKEYIHFGRYYGNPWGTQNSRRQMIEQLRNTLNDKFDTHKVYFADMSHVYYGESYLLNGYESRTWKQHKYPLTKLGDPLALDDEMGIANSKTFLYLENPYVDPKVNSYQFGRSIINNGNVIFSTDNYIDFTNNEINYAEYNHLAIEKEKNDIKNRGVFKELKRGRDIFWSYNAFYVLKDEVLELLPIGSDISIEYEYTMDYLRTNRNVPTRISQVVSIGRVNGDKNQKFMNPEVIADRKNISKFRVNGIWINAIRVDDFSITQISNEKYEIKLNINELLKGDKSLAMKYDQSNYYELKNHNKITQKFELRENVPWNWDVYTRDGAGYIKKPTNFRGFVIDSEKYEDESVFHMDENMDLDTIVTSSVATGGDILKPIRYGVDDQDIIQLNTLKRKNNFIVSFDFIYDSNIERELMRFDIFLKAKFSRIAGIQQLTDFYALTVGVDKGITFSNRKVDVHGNVRQDVLAQIQDIGAVLKRDTFYTIKVKVIRDVVEMYFNKRNEEEKFYFSIDLKSGHEASNEEIVAENKFGGLNVVYNDPTFFVNGDKFGLKAMTHKVNFSNFDIVFIDANNLLFGNPFNVTNYDAIVSSLKRKFSIEGVLKTIKKNSQGYEYILIGDTAFSRRNGGDFVMHNMVVEKMEIFKDKCFIQERVSQTAPLTVVNVYVEGFKLTQNIIVNGKQLADEPIVSFLMETNKKATNIEKIDGKLFITIDYMTTIVDNWEDMDATWEEYYAPWNLY